MTSLMQMEIAECPRVAHEASRTAPAFHALASIFRQARPPLVVLCGRGSSGHAALFLRYLFETRLLTPVSLAAPSVASAYGARLRLRGAWFIALSQSGESPDLIAAAQAAGAAGAITIAFINAADSPLGNVVTFPIPLRAGPEASVAATKSVLAAMTAGARLVAELAGDLDLHAALDRLPLRVERALACDWSPLSRALMTARDVYVVGRGMGLAIARETALKMAEVLRIPAMAYSAAEILHGPRAAIRDDSLVLAFEVDDETAPSVRRTVKTLAAGGARTLSCGGGDLEWIGADHPATDAIAMGAAAWRLIEAHAQRLGYDPDRPPFLDKVTRTL
ncbi:MAG: SIS domain-containing protein [Beijerinckiaceae bacterium]|nr:SIS domain-containing protein [Beijerinckiaceae bacterium]